MSRLAWWSLILLSVLAVGWNVRRTRHRDRAVREATRARLAEHEDSASLERIERVRRLIDSGVFIGLVYPGPWGSLGEDDARTVHSVLDAFERIAGRVRGGQYDAATVFEHYGEVGLTLWTHLRPYVRHVRHYEPDRWRDFEWLAIDWMRRSQPRHHPGR